MRDKEIRKILEAEPDHTNTASTDGQQNTITNKALPKNTDQLTTTSHNSDDDDSTTTTPSEKKLLQPITPSTGKKSLLSKPSIQNIGSTPVPDNWEQRDNSPNHKQHTNDEKHTENSEYDSESDSDSDAALEEAIRKRATRMKFREQVQKLYNYTTSFSDSDASEVSSTGDIEALLTDFKQASKRIDKLRTKKKARAIPAISEQNQHILDKQQNVFKRPEEADTID